MRYAGARLPNLDAVLSAVLRRLAYTANGRCDVRNLTRKNDSSRDARNRAPGHLLGATDSVVDTQFLGLPRNKTA